MLSPDTIEGFPRSLDETRLEKNRSGNYEVRWTVRDATGRARTKTYSCGTADRSEAILVRNAWWSALWQVKASTPARTVGELIRLYKTLHVETAGTKPTQSWALVPVERELGNNLLPDLTALGIANYIAKRRREGKADGTIRRELGALRAVLGWALTNREIPADTILPKIPMPPASAGREVWLDADEADRMFDLATQDEVIVGSGTNAYKRLSRVGRFVCLALEAPARAASIESLKWAQVNFATRVIDFRRPGVQTKKRRVPVPISDKLFPILERAYRERTSEWVLDEPGSNKKAFARFREQHGFDVTRHDLRRTWATLRAQWGVSLFDIAGILGDDIKTVTKHYAHHCPDFLRGAVNAKRPGA